MATPHAPGLGAATAVLAEGPIYVIAFHRAAALALPRLDSIGTQTPSIDSLRSGDPWSYARTNIFPKLSTGRISSRYLVGWPQATLGETRGDLIEAEYCQIDRNA